VGFQGWLVMIGFLLSEAANAEPKMDGGSGMRRPGELKWRRDG